MEKFGSLNDFLKSSISERGAKYKEKQVCRPHTACESPKQTLAERLYINARNYDNRPSCYRTPSRATVRSASACQKRGLNKSDMGKSLSEEKKTSKTSEKIFHKKGRKFVKAEEKISLQEQVRNELLLKNDHFLIRSMKKIIRNDEEKVKNEEKETTLFSRLAKRFNDPDAKVKESEIKAIVQTENLVQKHKIVKAKEIRAVRAPWMKKRGFFEVKEDNELSRQVFALLEHNGELKCSELLNLLVEIGVPLPLKIIKATLATVFKTRRLDSHVITESEIIDLCKTGSFGRHFFLAVSSSLPNQPSKFTSADIDRTLTLWWSTLNHHHRNQIHLNDISEFLYIQHIISDKSKARKLLDKIFSHSLYIDFNQFLMIFSKFVIKFCLASICKKILESSNECEYLSKRYSLELLKKKLLMAGVNVENSLFSAEEGRITIKNIERLNEPIGKMTYEAFCRHWSDTTGQEFVKGIKADVKSVGEKSPVVMSIFNVSDAVKIEESNEKLEESLDFYSKNRFTILGDLNIHSYPKGKWNHSISDIKSPFKVSTGESESRTKQQQASFLSFEESQH